MAMADDNEFRWLRVCEHIAQSAVTCAGYVVWALHSGEDDDDFYSAICVHTRRMREYAAALDGWARDHGGMHPDERGTDG